MNKFSDSFLPRNPAKTTAIGHSVMSGSRDANLSLSLAMSKCRLAHIRFIYWCINFTRGMPNFLVQYSQ